MMHENMTPICHFNVNHVISRKTPPRKFYKLSGSIVLHRQKGVINIIFLILKVLWTYTHFFVLGTPEPNQELPPPPPIPKQVSPPKQQTPVQAPPPPPPPPMPMISNGPIMLPPLVNGDLAKIISSSPPKLTPVKDRPIPKQAPPMDDPRNDLLKAIRDGIKLRKVICLLLYKLYKALLFW